MKRLTTDNPQDNFSTMLNYVFSKDGYAYIRSDGKSDDPVPLTEWANRRCIQRKCISKAHTVDVSREIDERICDCAFMNPECPVFLAYTFACQAVHMRDRCKTYEDAEEQGRLVVLDEPRKPIIWGDEAHDSVYCPNCGEDLMGIPYGNQIVVNCPFCGEYIDATKTVTREAAETALKEMERENG